MSHFLTLAAGDMATTTIRQHTALYYLNEARIDLAGASPTLSATFSGGTVRVNTVWYSVYDFVDQASPITNSRNYNSATAAITYVFGTALNLNYDDQSVEVISALRSGNTITRTITPATNWSLGNEQTYTTTDGVRNGVYNRSISTTTTTDLSSTTISGTALGSMTGISLNARTKQFQTVQTGTWGILSTWNQSMDDGTTWVVATTIPANTDGLVTIQSGHTVTLGAAATANNLTTQSTGLLNCVTYTLGITGTPTNGGTIQTQNTSTTPIPTGKTWGGTVVYDGVAQTIVTGAYNNLTLSGSGTKTLAAATPSISGILTVKAGTTLALSTFALGGTTAPSSVVLEIGSTGSIITGSGALNLGGDITVNNITGNSGATISCPVQLDADRTFTIADDGTTASDLTISGVISTAFGLSKAGAGLLTLSGANTYTGSTTISTGVLNIQNATALGTTATGTTVSNLAALQIQGGITVAEAITLQSPGISFDGGIRNISEDNTLSGLITLSGSSEIASDAGTLTLDVASGNAITGTYNLTFSGAGNTTVADPIATSSATLIKEGAGTLTLSATNTYAGTTTVNGGILSFSAFGSNGFAGSNGNGTLVLGGGTLQYTGSTASTVQNITLTASTSSSVDIASGTTLTMTGANPASTGSLAKLGAGTLVLSGTSSFTGGTTITEGTLALGAADKLDNTGSIILNGGTLSSGATGFNETIGTLDLNANSTIALGTGNHTLTFANSSAVTWTGSTMLTITGWTGVYDGASSGTAGKIFVGSSASGLTAGQLAQIQFFDGSINNPAIILSTGELVASCVAPTNLSYITPQTYTKNAAITNLTPTVTGYVASYSVSPALPAGLSMNTSTGVISGTPTVSLPTITYTITATNTAGSTTFPIVITVSGPTFYSRATGVWNSNTTWSTTSGGPAVAVGVWPIAGDVVNIEGGFTVTAAADAQCASIQLGHTGATASAGTLTFSNSSTLTVSGAVLVGNNISGSSGTITFTSGSTLISGSLRIGGTIAGALGSVNMTSGGTLSLSGAVTIGTGAATWTPGTGTVIFTGDNILPSTIFTSFNNLQINGGTTTTGANIPAIATLTVGASGTFATASTYTITAATILVDGTFTDVGTGALTVTNLTVNGTWNHNSTALDLPIGSSSTTWAAASYLNINGFTGTSVSNIANFMGQTFGNVTFNCSGLTAPGSLTLVPTNGTTTVQGNFTITSMGTGTLYMRITGTIFTGVININGDFILTSGIFDMHNGGPTPTDETINLAGNFMMTGGTIQQTTTTVGSRTFFNFTKSGTQTFTKTGGTIESETTVGPGILFSVLSGSILDMGTSILDGTNETSFSLNAGAGIITANTGGLSASGATGSIQVANTRTFSTDANYTYNGSSAQVTGDGLPTSVNNLTMSNAAGVTFSATEIINGTLEINTGAIANLADLTSYAANLTFNGVSQTTGSWGSTTSPAAHTNDTFFAATTGIVIAGPIPPLNLSYTSPNSFIIGTLITPLSPTVTGTITNYSVSPALPAGLSISSSTGIISGTPTVSTVITTYTVTASNSAGSTTFDVVIGVGSYRYAVASAAWNVTSTWSVTSGGSSGASVPVAGDYVFIGEAATDRSVTIPSGYSAACATLTMGNLADNTVATLSFSASSSSLTVSGDLTMNRPNGSAISAIGLGAGSLTVNGDVTIGYRTATSTSTGRINRITISTGILTVGGDLIYGAQHAAQSQIVFSDAGTLNIAGNFTLTLGTLTPSTGTVNFNGTSVAQTIPIGVSAVTYYNLAVNNTSSGGATLSAAITGSNVSNNISVGNISTGSLLNTNNLAVGRNSSDALTIAAGSVLDAGTTSITWGGSSTATINGTFKTANTAGFSGGSTAINSSNSPTITLGSSSTIEYNASGSQTVTTRTYNNLVLSGSGNKTISNGTTISSNLSISGTAKGRLSNGGSSTAQSITFGGINQASGSWGSTGSAATHQDDTWFVAANTGIINVSSVLCADYTAEVSGTATICNGSSTNLMVTITGGISPYTVVYSGGTVNNYTSGSAIAVSPSTTTTYTLTSVTDAIGCTATLSGSGVITVTASLSAVSLSPSGTQTTCVNGTGTLLTAAETDGGTITARAWGKRAVSGGTITPISGATSQTYTPSGADLGAGTWYVVCTSTPACGSAVISNEVTITITASGIWIGGTSGALTDWNTAANWSCGILPDLTTNVLIPNVTNKPVLSTGSTGAAGNIIINNGSSLTVTGNTLQIAGDISNSGTFTATAGTIEMKGAASQSIGAATFAGNTILNLTITNAADVTLGGALNVTGIVKATTGNLASAGYLTLISTAVQTALIDGAGTGTITGNVTMQRYLASAFGYKYFSSPFTSSTVNEFGNDLNLSATFPTFYKYDEDNHRDSLGVAAYSSGWVTYTTTSNSLVPLNGYAANFGAASAAKTVDMTGVVNNGSLSVSLFNHNRKYTKGFNLVGNPYPSPIDWNAVSGWTKTNIDNGVYFFNAGNTDQYTGTYSSYVNGISTGIADNTIAAMQGFFVHVSAGTFPVSATLGVTNAVRTNNLNPLFKRALIDNRTILRFAANFDTKNAIADAAVIYFDNQANNGFDPALDALKMTNTDVLVPNIYTLSTDPKQLSINGRPLPTDSITKIPLGITTFTDGWVNFDAKDISQLPSSLYIYLVDSEKGITQDLKQTPEYRFYLKAGVVDQRFKLVFSLSDLTKPVVVTTKMFTISSSSSLVLVRMDLPFNTRGSLMVTNMSGQVILRREVFEQETVEVNPGTSSGVFIITVISGNRTASEKILIRQNYE
jgi:fibronectin-binding autotransporter adhesin